MISPQVDWKIIHPNIARDKKLSLAVISISRKTVHHMSDFPT